MKIADMLLPELDHEAAVTRLLIEGAPERRASWTPHPRARTLGELCLHLAQLPLWGVRVMQQTTFDLTPPEGTDPFPRPGFVSQQATLATFDEHVTQARALIADASDPEFLVPWILKDAGHVVFTMPRLAVLRSLVLSHLVHHRGQLTVYLRLCDVALPPIYGPTADSAALLGHPRARVLDANADEPDLLGADS
jgi:uncharacterized damage-inducible protein DinB